MNQEDKDKRGLRAFEIDPDTVRVNNPDPEQPDHIVRQLASGKVEVYEAQKKKDDQ